MNLFSDSDDSLEDEKSDIYYLFNRKIQGIVTVSVVLIFITYCYASFIFSLLIPLKWYKPGFGVIHIVIFNWFAFFHCYSFWKSTTLDPGFVSSATHNDDAAGKLLNSRLKIHESLKELDPERFRYCNTCRSRMPPRSHHCRECESCVLRMDHHCPWINNCVGLNNYKHFLLLLIYGLGATGYIILASFHRAYLCYQNYENGEQLMGLNAIEAIFLVLNFLLVSPIAISLTCLLLFHMKCMLSNKTSIEELIHKTMKKIAKKNGIKNLKWVYHAGWINNFKLVFGSNPLIWFLPITETGKMDGYNYPIRREYSIQLAS